MVALGVWRAQDMQQRHRSLEHASVAAASLEHAHVRFLEAMAVHAALVWAQDPTLGNLYSEAMAEAEEGLSQARDEALSSGREDQAAALDALIERLDGFTKEMEPFVAALLDSDPEVAAEMAAARLPEEMPATLAIRAELDRLVHAEQSDFTAERVAADRASDVTLALLVGIGGAALLGGSALVVILILSVVRPLTLLRASVKSIASGDLRARAAVTGPEEVASLAREFNEMVGQRRQAEEALRDSEERLRTVVANVPVFLFAVDRDGVVTFADGKGIEGFWWRPDQVLGRSMLDEFREVPQVADNIRRALAGETFVGSAEVDGLVLEVYHAPLLDEDGQVSGMIGVATDITERKRAEEMFETLARSSPIGMYIVQDGRFRFLNAEFQEHTGYRAEELLGADSLSLVLPEDRGAVREKAIEMLKGLRSSPYEYRVVNKAGEVRWSIGTVASIHYGGRRAVAGTYMDITERKRAEEALHEQARRDQLTGLLNHGAIVEELRRLVSDGIESPPCTVAVIDVDGMKAVNDTYGHQMGDAVLVAVARALSRQGATVGRYGGDEFVAILPGGDREDAKRYREEVLDALAGTSLRDPESGSSVPVAVSVGTAVYPHQADRVEDLLRLADSAMYASRRQRPVASTGRILQGGQGGAHAAQIVGEMVPLLTSPGELSEKLRLVAHRLSVGVGYDGVDFVLMGSGTEAPPTRSALAHAPDDIVESWNREHPDLREHPLVATLEQARRPVILDSVENEERLTLAERSLLQAAGLKSALIAPMLWRDELVGTLSVASKRPAAFGPADAQFVMAVATQVTAIVRMATLVDRLQSASRSLEDARSETVMMLAAAAEAHDHTTGIHLRNVRAIAQALARELGYSEKDSGELGLAATLHDIGKVRVPDSVLASTGRLASEEWDLMKHHTTWGAEFLAGRPGFELAATIARSHHEHWDGSGYPDGLSGEDIPEAAAIVAVADAFDAMTSQRPYRAARSIAAATRETMACSGTQFSPRVAEALLRLHKRRKLPRPVLQPTEDRAAA